MQDERNNQPVPSSPAPGEPRKRRKKTANASYQVELVTAQSRNPANPTSHLDGAERRARLAKLWAEMFRRLRDGK